MRPQVALCIALALAWLAACAEPPATDPIARGRQVYRQLDCGRCHHIAGSGGRLAPELTHIGTVAQTQRPSYTAEEYIRESILEPGRYVVPGYGDVMPRGLALRLSERDLDALVRYLASLR